VKLDPKATALLVIDLQNDTVGEEGGFASSGAAAFAAGHRVVERATQLADGCRAAGA
jgi:nicotinamidase-related amidase